MKIFSSGFNLYGQFSQCQNLIIKQFNETNYENIKNLEPSHTYNIALGDNHIILFGPNGSQILPSAGATQIACNENLIILLNKNGELHKIDLNQPSLMMPLPILNLFGDESCDKIVKISAGKNIYVALSQLGQLFNLPNKLHFENRNVVDICAGSEHCLALDKNGDVYSFGTGSRGQLGHGDLDDQVEPKLIRGLAGIRIVKIAAGGWHSCAISAEGDLYTWGWNGNGQLGLKKDEDNGVSVMGSPHVVDFDSLDINVMKVACGNRHTIVFLDNGKLYGSGWNKYHQLGDPDSINENIYEMTFLHDFSKVAVSDLKCGPWSSIIIINDNK